jgi:DNA polymerase-3 subunit gamma/tau
MAKSKAEYTVLARRYRPQQFDDLIGQEPVAQALRNALASGRVAHAYLFTGARGVGKTSAARILAKALNCIKGPSATPCDQCSSCLAIAAGDDIDVREIDGASNRGIDDVRAIRQDVSTRPTRGRYKIYIIDEVHMLTKESFNALLKTLEEPPPHVKFIFATTEVQKVPITILSRCQRFDFGSIRSERIAQHLRDVVRTEKVKADDEALEILARRAAGSMRDAQSLLDQLLAFGGDSLSAETVQKLLGVAGPERVIGLAEAIFQHDAKAALERLSDFAAGGGQLTELLDELIDYWRDLMLVASAGKEVDDLHTPTRHRETLCRHAATLNLDSILAGLDILTATKGRLRGSGQAQTLIQMALIRLCRLEELAPLSQIAYWLSQGASTSGSQDSASGGSPRGAAKPIQQTASAEVGLAAEAKKKGDPAEINSVLDLTPENLELAWAQILAQIGGILAGQLQRSAIPAIFGPNTLVLSVPAEYNVVYQNPQNVERIEGALRHRTGRVWMVRLEQRGGAAAAPTGPGGEVANGAPLPTSAHRRQEAMRQVPLLERALDVLGALPMHLDPGFGATPADAGTADADSAEGET